MFTLLLTFVSCIIAAPFQNMDWSWSYILKTTSVNFNILKVYVHSSSRFHMINFFFFFVMGFILTFSSLCIIYRCRNNFIVMRFYIFVSSFNHSTIICSISMLELLGGYRKVSLICNFVKYNIQNVCFMSNYLLTITIQNSRIIVNI